MPNVSLRKGMLEDIASRYQVDCGGFKLCGQIVNLLREDVTNIMALRTTGFDVENYIDTTKKSDIEIVNSDFFKRFADTNNKLELHKLESMISVKKPADDDFKRAFVLFTIGVILASPTGTNIHFSYIEVVRDVSKLRHFNWGQFTLNHLLNSCHTYVTKGEKTVMGPLKKKTVKGNLLLLQVSSIWYKQDLRTVFIFDLTYFLCFCF